MVPRDHCILPSLRHHTLALLKSQQVQVFCIVETVPITPSQCESTVTLHHRAMGACDRSLTHDRPPRRANTVACRLGCQKGYLSYVVTATVVSCILSNLPPLPRTAAVSLPRSHRGTPFPTVATQSAVRLLCPRNIIEPYDFKNRSFISNCQRQEEGTYCASWRRSGSQNPWKPSPALCQLR
jgi:hypothetical protein